MKSSVNPLFNWLDQRAAGVLLHPTSLPSDQGIGVLDGAVDRFFDFLNESGISYWQICPLGPTGFGDSPYQCFSAFAGNPYLIDLHVLVDASLLSPSDLVGVQSLPRDAVDFGLLYATKWPLLFKAYDAFVNAGRTFDRYGDFAAFRTENATWLDPYAGFLALKDHFEGRAWWDWPAEVRFFTEAKSSKLWNEVADRADAHAFFQYLFFGQWNEVRAKAADRGIQIIGDAPIFVAADSADVWSHPELFEINQNTGRAIAVAGVPPDYFSADGQLWGNPLYRWKAHQADGYAWWIDRLKANIALCNVVRIDHFRGFDTYWSIAAGAPTARKGTWETGPGLDFFTAVKSALPDCKLIAEDLGELAPSVVDLRYATGLPGMTILQFAFGGDASNVYLPHNLEGNSVIYPGTHDNDTTLGWYRTADAKTTDHVRRYLRVAGDEIGWDFIRVAYGAVSNLAVVPLQDFMSLGGEARLNTPGLPQGNWQWRYNDAELAELVENAAPYLRDLAELTGRV
ncbi:4-alpha-glucanotransferase [Synoicihabitans lomoniglobus]|uniref:4-alpha-glucanotransferase n=1 Tax=Synoicihabitans lomoniglobus TaxID=2909285 RepID=A0AAF0CRW8_9BACT|nr:4-alpha-glucanotransferase [Opitutaceae bacterium LMO-M01]WED66861.1 4-alpha-glucanotransferase [Opitutaceae bacterium LMO-M01]